MRAKRMRTTRQQLIEEPATLADRTANGAGADTEPARELALEEGDLNARIKAKGMYSIDEMMGSLPLDKWRVHSGMTDLKFFGAWLERKTREYCTMRAAYEVGDKDESDELYEWVLAHYGAFHDVLVNFRAALSSPAHADAGNVEGDGWLQKAGELYDRCKLFPETSAEGFTALLQLRNHVAEILPSAPSEGAE